MTITANHGDRQLMKSCCRSPPTCSKSVSSVSNHAHSLHLLPHSSIPISVCILTSWPCCPPAIHPPPPPLRPVMAPVVATPTPSPPPLWWVTESCGLHREREEAVSTHVLWRASPDGPPSSRSVVANYWCLTPLSFLSPHHHFTPFIPLRLSAADTACCYKHFPDPFQNRDTDKKAGDAKGDASSQRGVPIKQVGFNVAINIQWCGYLQAACSTVICANSLIRN